MTRLLFVFWCQLAVALAIEVVRNSDGDEICLSKECVVNAAKILDNMNASMDPCENFYNFACGGFVEHTVIPDSKASLEPWDFVIENMNSRLRQLIEEPVLDDEPAFSRNVKIFYKSCMNTATIEKRTRADVLTVFKFLGGWPILEGDCWKEEEFEWPRFVYKARELGLNDPFLIHFSVATDLKNSSWRAVHFDQPALLMKRSAYFKGLENSLVKAYHEYQMELVVLLGADRYRAEKEVWEVFEFEKKLASITVPDEERRDYSQQYEEYTLKEMEEKWKGIPFFEYTRKMLPSTVNISEHHRVICEGSKYLTELPMLLKYTSKRTIANYLFWRVAFGLAVFMNDDVRKLQTAYKRSAFGVTEKTPRWEECVSLTLSLQAAVGALYVRHFFNHDAKLEATEMAINIREAFLNLLDRNTWMDDITRERAKEKLASMMLIMAYSDELLNDTAINEYYNELGELGDDFLVNSLRITKFGLDYFLGLLETPVDRGNWIENGNTADVNAYHVFPRNLIQFPAGVLQLPYFQVERPRYMNYGAIGMLIGHELSHGFDDRGALFDKNGMITNWWAPDTKMAYNKKLECIIKQYGSYSVGDGHYFNGIITQGEASADNAGMKQAYLAYQSWVSKHKPEPRLPGLQNYTQNQLFWLSAATSWCSKYRPIYLHSAAITKEHPTGEYRIIGILANSEFFAKDFNCPVGSPMNPVHKCIIW